MTLLTLIRHGETDWNRQRLIQGSTDIPLNETGYDQARAAADRLAAQLVDPSRAYVVSSDLTRARQTADVIAQRWGAANPRRYDGLRERAYGDAEGVSIEEFGRRWGSGHTAEVPGAESREALQTRALAALDLVVSEALIDDPDLVRVFVVTHGALIRSVIHHVSGGVLPATNERLPNGSDYTFAHSPAGLVLVEYAGALTA